MDPEEEHTEIDFERIYLIGRARCYLTQEELYRMTFGRWADIFHEYRRIYNFETKNMLYKDAEEEWKREVEKNKPIDSLLVN